MKEVPYFELEFAGFFTGKFITLSPHHPQSRSYLGGRLAVVPVADLEPGSLALAAVRDNLFAEVNIPYRLDHAAYTYTFHLFHKLNHQLAVEEVMILKEIIADIHADYAQRAQPRGTIEIEA